MLAVHDSRLSPVAHTALISVAGATARLSVNGVSVMKIWSEAGVPGSQMGPIQTALWIK